ncbi:MAG TPA: imidazolonepropionase, partial [Vicinamibacteria bacterium]|nr:imidazolonepropionase [Vicinamibacteria bacterium]
MRDLTPVLVVRNIGRLLTLAGAAPRTGAAMRELGEVAGAAVAIRGDRIAWTGPEPRLPEEFAGAPVVDARGAAVLPGL